VQSVAPAVGSKAARSATIVAAILLAWALAAPTRGLESDPTRALLSAAELAPVVVVGRVGQVAKLDASAYLTSLRVTRALRGKVSKDTELSVAWEELARGRPPRLAAGQTVVLALDDPPSASLWRSRSRDHAGLRIIAADGDAWLRDPSAADLQQLSAYLALAADAAPARRASALAGMAQASSDALSAAAVARLAATPTLLAALRPEAEATLAKVAADTRRPEALRHQVIELAGRARLSGASATLESLAAAPGPLHAEALATLGQIRGGLPAAQVEALLEGKDPALRAVAARYATGALVERTLPTLARSDPTPAVRIAAVETLAATRTVWGRDACLPVLADNDPPVRAAAAAALGRLGEPAVPALENAARQSPAQAAGAVTALSLAGPSGIAALRRLQNDGPTETVRDLARLALGQGPHAH
jgi:hypothetical protein